MQITKKLFNYPPDLIRQTFSMAWPAMLESFFVCFAGLVDTLMVSGISSDAVAAVGLTTQPKFIALALFMATGVATSAIVARRRGQNDKHSANSTLITTLLFVLIAAIAISFIFVRYANGIIRLCGSSSDTHDMAVTYARIINGCMIFNCIQIAINSAQRGAGNTKITMYTNVTSNIINIILNYLLIGGHFGFPALGIRGAAIATVLGTVVSCVMSIISICHADGFLSIKYIIKEKIRPTIFAFKGLISFGYSVFLEQILLRIGFAATAIMAASMGDDPMAAHQVAMNISSISFAFGDGLQSAAVALIGRSLGEKNIDKAKIYAKICLTIGGCISVVMAFIYFFGAELLMGLFFEEEHIIKIGVSILFVLIFSVIFQIRQVIYMGSLRGAGDTKFTAIVTTISCTFVRTAVSYICGYIFMWGIVGIWLGIVADQLFRFIFAYFRFRQGKWTTIKI